MEQSGGGKIWKPWHKDEFSDLVLSWSLQEILDENLYKNKVDNIPYSFESVDQYLGSYFFPLLEDTRAGLASAMETVHKAPFAEVTSLNQFKHGKLVYDVMVDRWRNRTSDSGSEPYRTLPGDLVLLSDMKPETDSDLLRAGSMFTLASVMSLWENVDDDRNLISLKFEVKTAKHIEFVGEGRSRSLYVVFLTKTTTNERIWNSLHMRQNLKIIQKVLNKNDLVEEKCSTCTLKSTSEIEKKIDPTLFSKLNESQKEAILACQSKIECSHKPSVELIWGPPGTGKTAILCILLHALLKTNVRTLICAPTNAAITELASQVVAVARNSVEDEPKKSLLFCPLGDILIFGNKDRLKVSSTIEDIFLDYRVKRLVQVLLPQTGWKHCLESMINFLQDCIPHHRAYLKNEPRTKGLPDRVKKFRSKSLLEFARERFTHVIRPLRTCMSTLSTHLPRSLIREESIESIVELMHVLDAIEKKLFEDSGMTSKELNRIFSERVTSDADSFVDRSSFVFLRSSCVSILRFLRDSLHRLLLPVGFDRWKTEMFCYQNASLIFCTTSTAYKLHSVAKKMSFKFVVIDEAAQVKECESIIALQIPDVRHAILVGDERQLPATVSSKVSDEAGFGRSLFERLSTIGHTKHLLNVQYRMHPSISRFPNSNFYLNQISDGPNVQSESHERRYLEGRMFGPYSFINIRYGKEQFDDVGRSRLNLVEVAIVVELVQKLFKAWTGSQDQLSIGLISPYAAQVATIQDKLRRKYENIARFTVKVKAIDGFQGGEEDVIILSTVRSNRRGSIGFLSSPQRTNVALTRARHCLWILGNERTLRQSDSVWDALILDAKSRGCFFNADEDCDLRKTIIDAKKKSLDLEDLLSGDSILFKNSTWKVLFSDTFRKSFQKLKPSYVKKMVIDLLVKIASGWRPKQINVDLTCERSSGIVKQFKVENHHVVCSVDIISKSIYEQVLKVWDVVPMREIPELLKRLDDIFLTYTDDFINHCNEKSFRRNLEVPKSWPISKNILRFKNLKSTNLSSGASSSAAHRRSYVENSELSEILLLTKFDSLSSSSVSLLVSDLDRRKVDLTFEVMDKEREMIQNPKSNFMLGQSGSGNRTVSTMKPYHKLQQHCIASRDSMVAENNSSFSNKSDVLSQSESRESKLHQHFVAVNPKPCYAVESQLKRLAQCAIDLVSHFFPQSKEALPPEKSHIFGDSPAMHEPGSDKNSITTMCGYCSNESKIVDPDSDENSITTICGDCSNESKIVDR